MHIVHIEDFFHPMAGYKYNIISKYMVKLGHRVTIVVPSLDNRNDILTDFFGKSNIEEFDREFTKKYGVDIVRLNVKKYFRTRAIYNLHELNDTVQNLKPDILSIGMETIPSYYFLLKYKKLNFPIVLDCHNIKEATTFFLAPLHHFIHRIIFSPIIKRNDIRVIRCFYDNYIEECLNVPVKDSPVVSFGSDLSLFHKDENIYKEFRQNNNLSSDDLVFVYMGKLDNSKGGNLLVEAFLKKFNTNKKISLLVVGKNNNENPDYIENMLNNSENIIIRFPTQKYIDMPKFYQMADVALFPRQCSLSFFDAQACGLPVILEDLDVNLERVSHNNGFVFKSGDVKSLRDCIQKYIDLSDSIRQEMSKNATEYIRQNYDYFEKTKEYINVLDLEYNKFKSHSSKKY